MNAVRYERTCFTLVELMVAMAILSIIMLSLFRLIQSSQRAWNFSESRARIYENSRVVFDLLEADFTSLMTSTVPSSDIGYYIGDPAPSDWTDCLHVCFVAAVEANDDADSRLCEVSYAHHIDPAKPSDRYQLRRQVVSDQDSANWDFYGMPTDWQKNNIPNGAYPAAYERVVGGVKEFSIRFFAGDGSELPAGSTTTRPAKVVVDLVLIDQELVDASDERQFQTQRAFTKIFYLDQIYH